MKHVNAAELTAWPQDNLFTSRSWLDVLSGCYGFTFRAVPGGDGAPPLFFSVVEDIFGKRIVALPFSDYTDLGPCSSEEITALAAPLKEAYPALPVTLKLLGDHDLSGAGFTRSRSAFCHRISLEEELETIWQRTSHAFRKGVAKAQRSGLTFRIDNSEEGLDAFYRLLVQLRRNKYRILPQSRDFYARLLERFCADGAGYLCTVQKDGKVVAAALILRSGAMLFDKMGVSDTAYQELRPNNLLLWEVMKLGKETGATHLDMGLTQADHEGLLAFKDGLGGERTPVFYHRYNPEGFDEAREKATKEMLKGVTEYLVGADLDQERLSEAGGLLYKYFC